MHLYRSCRILYDASRFFELGHGCDRRGISVWSYSDHFASDPCTYLGHHRTNQIGTILVDAILSLGLVKRTQNYQSNDQLRIKLRNEN